MPSQQAAGSLIKSDTWLNKPDPFSIGTLVCIHFIKHSLPCFWALLIRALLIVITKKPVKAACINPYISRLGREIAKIRYLAEKLK